MNIKVTGYKVMPLNESRLFGRVTVEYDTPRKPFAPRRLTILVVFEECQN